LVRIKKIRLSSLLVVFSMIMLAFLSMPALAGEGDGSGGGQGEPLRLDSSSPYNGQSGVSTDVLITMTFNKNVVNMTVSENNLNCFSLYAADGSKVPVEVIMADDQIEPEKKRIISLQPLQDLKYNTAYTVKVSSALQSKSGNIMSGDLTITFITAKGGTTTEPAVSNTAPPQNADVSPPAGTAEPQAVQAGQGGNNAAGTAGAASTGGNSPAASAGDNAAGSGAQSQVEASGGQGDAGDSDQPGGSKGAGLAVWIIAIAALVLIAAGYFISRRKK
jgi:hypothetical protein